MYECETESRSIQTILTIRYNTNIQNKQDKRQDQCHQTAAILTNQLTANQ